ncbi:MAG TPA: AAA family ATPase [Thermodesulfobacteriota bacterium]|nr:AAA family ATPase [Thermodesulfobacteriota bacterium]
MRYYKGLIKFLSDPATYGLKNKNVNVIQTHASYVFIAGNFVYKLKKPVNFGFLDFSTLGKRKYYCEQEVSLNSRLSNSYLGVVPVMYDRGNYSFQKNGVVCDYLVKMKRIPERYFVKNLLAKNKISKREIKRISDRLHKFYILQTPPDKLPKYGSPKHIKNTLKQNRELGEKFVGKTITRTAFETIKYFNNLFLRVNKERLERRVSNGYIKDCHGDLHLEHVIVRQNEIEIFDCIEFNNSFRFIDYVCDIAFLSMDLDYNARFDLSRYFISSILNKMEDSKTLRLVDFYKCYRAYVRGKVGSIRAEDKNLPKDEKVKSVQNAKKYFQLSTRYALFGSDPVVIVIFGLIASGKSTFADRLSSELGCNVISSDVTRKNLAGIPLTQKAGEHLYDGLYSKNMTNKTYDEMFKQAHEQLLLKNIVILDASFSAESYRNKIINNSQKWKSNIIYIETKTSDKVIKQRLLARDSNKSISDARIGLFKSFKQKFNRPSDCLKDIYFKTNTNENTDSDKNIKRLFREIIKRRISNNK